MKFSRSIPLKRKRNLKPQDLRNVYKKLRQTFGPQHWWPGETALEVMVGAILTQNTAWTNVEKAILNLKRSKKLSFQALQKISLKKLAQLIRPAGYFNIKADRLKHFFAFLARAYRGNLQRMRKRPLRILRSQLLGVKGIGPETADSMLLYALDKTSFVIDAYTKRIFSRHGLLSNDESYERWQKMFSQSLPCDRELYNDYHAQIVRLGKDFCRKEPRCQQCPLKSFFYAQKK